jgi:hypothetical protein
MLIEDIEGKLFGGFTPVKWELRDDDRKWKGDNSLRNFLFTLRNPRGVPPRKFALRAERKQSAIDGNSARGPIVGYSCIDVSDHCNANAGSHTLLFDKRYDTDSGGKERDFLMGAVSFRVKEIEVFEIAD